MKTEATLKELWIEADRKLIPQEKIDQDHVLKSIKMKSKHTIKNLKRKFVIDILVSALCIPIVVFVILESDNVLSNIGLIISIFFLGFSAYLYARAYQAINKELNGNLRENLLISYNKVKTILSSQNLIVMLMGCNVVLAFLFRAIVTDQFVFEDPMSWAKYVISLVVVVPLSYLVSELANKRKFGRYMKVLKGNIESLEQK